MIVMMVSAMIMMLCMVIIGTILCRHYRRNDAEIGERHITGNRQDGYYFLRNRNAHSVVCDFTTFICERSWNVFLESQMESRYQCLITTLHNG